MTRHEEYEAFYERDMKAFTSVMKYVFEKYPDQAESRMIKYLRALRDDDLDGLTRAIAEDMSFEDYHNLPDNARILILDSFECPGATKCLDRFAEQYNERYHEDMIRDPKNIPTDISVYSDAGWLIYLAGYQTFTEDYVQENVNGIDGAEWYPLIAHQEWSMEFKKKHPDTWKNPTKKYVAIYCDEYSDEYPALCMSYDEYDSVFKGGDMAMLHIEDDDELPTGAYKYSLDGPIGENKCPEYAILCKDGKEVRWTVTKMLVY